MREFRSAALVELDPGRASPACWPSGSRATRPGCRRAAGGRRLDPGHGAAFAAEVIAVAKGLVARGVEPGDRVALMSRTRYEWTLLDFAIWSAGAVAVPIYETSSAEQVAWILADSGAVALLVETAEARRRRRRGPRRAARPAPRCWSSTTARSTALVDGGRRGRRRRDRAAPRARPRPTTSRRSSTRRARPAGPRAASSRTATSSS